MTSWDLLVRLDDFRRREVRAAPDPSGRSLAPTELLLRVEKLALTANNVTYAAAGERLGYWRFFPAPPGWGRVPVWGYAEVLRSTHEGIAAGERVFGYVPMSSHFTLVGGRVGPTFLVDDSPHRTGLPAAYNYYERVGPRQHREAEDLQALLKPLFITSFLLDDLVTDRQAFGADAVVLSSASSKTAMGLAFLLRRRAGGPRVVGLTSDRHRRFVSSTGYYDSVLGYDAIEAIGAAEAALIDFAGNAATTGEVHRTLGGRLRASLRIGATHWEEGGVPGDIPGPRPEWFFAPDQIASRMREWGRDGFDARFREAWSAFVPTVKRWLTIVRSHGAEGLDRAFGALVDGHADPAEGRIWESPR